MGVVVSSSCVVSATPSSSRSSPAPAWDPTHGRQSFTNFSNQLLPTGCRSSQCAPVWVLSMGCSPSGTDCFSIGHPQGSRVLPEDLLQHGSSPRGHMFFQEPVPVRALHRVTASFGAHPPAPARCPPRAAGWISAPPWTSMCCRGTTCITMVFIMGCRGISAPAPGAPPSSLTLVSA